ncbi:MAG: type II toxin-antitoxin system VapC family toxin [Dermatophilaceae bacterium]
MIVLDASAVVDVVLDQPHRTWVLARIEEDTDLVAPAHQPVEVLSAVARTVRSGHTSARAGRAAMADSAALSQRLVLPCPAHLDRAYALRERVRVADGLYVALAEELGCPLVTTDQRLAAAAPPCRVLVPPAG